MTNLLEQLERGEITPAEANRRWLEQRAAYEARHPAAKKPPAAGLGDTVERLIDLIFFGKVKKCGGCARRKKWLNRRFPYRRKRGS